MDKGLEDRGIYSFLSRGNRKKRYKPDECDDSLVVVHVYGGPQSLIHKKHLTHFNPRQETSHTSDGGSEDGRRESVDTNKGPCKVGSSRRK